MTPTLKGLIDEASWSGSAIAPSSSTASAIASLITGLQPWKHQAIHPLQAELKPEILTLAEALGGLGFSTAAYRSNYWFSERFGYRQGFDVFKDFGQGLFAQGHLESLANRPVFLWINLLAPHPPYRRIDTLLDRLKEVPEGLPERITLGDLEPYFDPRRTLSRAERERLFSLYCLNVAWADRRLGQLLDALRSSGQWDETLLVVTSPHGAEFGEYGQIAHGGSLGRRLLEVPLVIKLPRLMDRRLEVAPGETPGIVRLFATLVEAAGGRVAPAVAPSLFRQVPAGVLSELYLTNGENHFSWVRDGVQLERSVRFGAPEPLYYAARLSQWRRSVLASEERSALFERLEARFRATPPLSGDGSPPELRLERWRVGGPASSVGEAALKAELDAELRRAWSLFQDEERALAVAGQAPTSSPES